MNCPTCFSSATGSGVGVCTSYGGWIADSGPCSHRWRCTPPRGVQSSASDAQTHPRGWTWSGSVGHVGVSSRCRAGAGRGGGVRSGRVVGGADSGVLLRGQRLRRGRWNGCALTDVAFRVACANQVPDHTVLARFRQVHRAGVRRSCSPQVLVMASRCAGWWVFGHGGGGRHEDRGERVAGRQPGSSSGCASRPARSWTRPQATDEAEDAAELAAGGPRTGSSWLRDPQQRAARLAELAAELDAVEPRREQASPGGRRGAPTPTGANPQHRVHPWPRRP